MQSPPSFQHLLPVLFHFSQLLRIQLAKYILVCSE